MKVSIECDPFELIDAAAKVIIAEGTTGQLSKLRVRLAVLYEAVNAADHEPKRTAQEVFPPAPFTEQESATRDK